MSLSELMKTIAELSAPFIVAMVGFIMLISKNECSDEFLKGAKNGFSSCIKMIPTLVLLIVGVHLFSASGALNLLCELLSAPSEALGIPTEIIPVIIMRPFSGSGSTAVMQKVLSEVSPDSFAGKCASIIMGSSDTIIYTIAMYFTSVGIKNTRHAIPASFIVLAFCVWLSVKLALVF